MSPESFDDLEYESNLTEGIQAVKAGWMEKARHHLERAARANRPDARPWLWLSATTKDPAEQRKYLECAMAADPFDQAARRGLATLDGKPDANPAGEVKTVEPAPPEEEAEAQSFLCPRCGGRLWFDPLAAGLRCEHCEYTGAPAVTDPNADLELPLDLALPTARAQRWAESQIRLSCERCGGVTLLPPGQRASQCPYCGSNQLVNAPSSKKLFDPQAIGLAKLTARQIAPALKKWLGSGLLTPDDLLRRASRMQLLPAYYPFWAFDGILEIDWACEVNTGTSKNPRWEDRHGLEHEIFSDVLAPGFKALPKGLIAQIEPLNLGNLVEFKPEHLAGWAALGYDISLADASLVARQKVLVALRRRLDASVEPGESKRNLHTGAGKWTAKTYKLVLLPFWTGTYEYKGQQHRLLVDGRSGKVAGEKPRDYFKVYLLLLVGLLLVILLALVGYVLLNL